MANLERLRHLRETVLANPETWSQRHWAKRTECGTYLCFAGWAVTLKGEEVDWQSPEVMQIDIDDFGYVLSGRVTTGAVIADSARGWLGLTREQADDLFYSDQFNGMDVLDRLISETEMAQEDR